MELLSSSSEESVTSESYDEEQPTKDLKGKKEEKIEEENEKHINYISANFLSRLFFSWSWFAIEQSKRKKILPNQISALDDSQTTTTNLKHTTVHWEKYKGKGYKYAFFTTII